MNVQTHYGKKRSYDFYLGIIRCKVNGKSFKCAIQLRKIAQAACFHLVQTRTLEFFFPIVDEMLD